MHKDKFNQKIYTECRPIPIKWIDGMGLGDRSKNFHNSFIVLNLNKKIWKQSVFDKLGKRQQTEEQYIKSIEAWKKMYPKWCQKGTQGGPWAARGIKKSAKSIKKL